MLKIEDILYIATGIHTTLLYTVASFSIGFSLAIVFAILQTRTNRYLKWLITFLISIIRGTPLILQISIFYFSLPLLTGYNTTPFDAGVAAISLNCAAYITEMFRSGIQSINIGQFEAAKTLGIPLFFTWRDIILPQVIRCIWPSLVNEFIMLTKETALISILGELDIMRRAQIVSAQNFTYFGPMLLAGLYYYVLILLITYIGKYIEKKWQSC